MISRKTRVSVEEFSSSLQANEIETSLKKLRQSLLSFIRLEWYLKKKKCHTPILLEEPNAMKSRRVAKIIERQGTIETGACLEDKIPLLAVLKYFYTRNLHVNGLDTVVIAKSILIVDKR
ncbi:hypothetical protein Bhyg_16358 [Pseudolycoriella hygida]|uniref:Uncharacterized protein n=1 Tax=Pseudolycoriella hygida TaxID=35572 RepID=A0A9Q0MN20_9DIPT|nr:hypothetical protein Bhyg_16358 [Pseudolycoriella hygida]